MAARSRPARHLFSLREAIVGGLLAVVLGGCAVPDVDTSIERSAATGTAGVEIHGAAGPLTAEESKLVLTSAGIDGSAADPGLAAHLVIEQAVAGAPLMAQNSVHVLRDGADTFREISAVIRSARHSVNLEYYTIEDVTLDDNLALLDLLLSKRRQGVAVSIMYDSYGSSDTPARFFEQLKAAGVSLLPFHPVAPGYLRNINYRDHRKILVADGEIAVLGGVNLSKSYESKAPGSSSREERLEEEQEHRKTLGETLGLVTPLPGYWLDTAIRIEGPVVTQVQTLFRDHWRSEGGPPLDEASFFPPLAAQGDAVVRVIGSTPDQNISRYYVTVVSAIRNAQSRIWLSAAYFVPTPAEKEALIAAARRGIDVRLLLPGESDSEKAMRAAESHYLDLLRAGVRIWQIHEAVLHSKCVIIDGVWSAIGSSNFDHRSVLFNEEVDAVILNRETAYELEQVFEAIARRAVALDAASWAANRPIDERMRAFFARLWESQL